MLTWSDVILNVNALAFKYISHEMDLFVRVCDACSETWPWTYLHIKGWSLWNILFRVYKSYFPSWNKFEYRFEMNKSILLLYSIVKAGTNRIEIVLLPHLNCLNPHQTAHIQTLIQRYTWVTQKMHVSNYTCFTCLMVHK